MSTYIYLSLHDDAPTTAVVAHGQTVFIDAPAHIQEIMIGGQVLRYDDVQSWWIWPVPRRMGRLWLIADDVPVTTIEIVSHTAYQEATTAWYRCLHDIDPRLTQPSRYWQPSGIRRADLEDEFAGATVSEILQRVLHIYDDAHGASLEPWYGDLRRLPRLDRRGVHTSAGGFLVSSEPQQSVPPALQRSLLQALTLLRSLCDTGESARCAQVMACVQQRVTVRSVWQLHLLTDWAQRILALVVSHEPGSIEQPYPDLALLYERWVWAHVLECVVGHTAFPDLMRTALDTATTARIAVNAHVWCGYQPRIAPGAHGRALWSRDDRLAIPDVLIACHDAHQGWRAVVFDAKYSMGHQQPTGQARNDVSAYRVRIGVGDRVPDWAALIHPGDQQAQYASGLHVYGTQSDSWDEIATTIQTWLRN
jgi:hypothetical protein